MDIGSAAGGGGATEGREGNVRLTSEGWERGAGGE